MQFLRGPARLTLAASGPALQHIEKSSEAGCYTSGNAIFCYRFREILTALMVEQSATQTDVPDFFFRDDASFALLSERLSALDDVHFILFEMDLRELHRIDEEDLQAVVPRRLQRAMKKEEGPSTYALIRMLHAGFTLPLVSRDGMYTLPFHSGLPGGLPSPLPVEIQAHALENGSALVVHAQAGKELPLRELHQKLARGQDPVDLFVVRIGFEV